MKPDGVATVALEPMETLEANPENEGVPAPGQENNQASSPAEGENAQQSQDDTANVEPPKETPAVKTSNKPSGDSKSKTSNKTKTKPGPTPTKTTTTTKSTANRITNGTPKPQANGVPKKTTPSTDKKTTLVTAVTKKPTGTIPMTKSTPKTAEKKTPTATPVTNGAKTTAAKKTPSTTANGVKTSSTTAAPKKPAGSKPANSTPTKPSTTTSPKTPISKTTRTPGTPAARPATSSTTKSSTAAPKPATPKTSASTSKPATSKQSTPSGGKAPASQTPKTATAVKKDVTKPSTPAAKKPAETSVIRTTTGTKSTKSDTPKSTAKSDTASKKPTTNKAPDTKTPNRSKPESKAILSKDAPKNTKTAAPKSTSPKKTVGSSTPTPVKRGPKATENGKDVTAGVITAAAIATAAAVIAKPDEQTSSVEVISNQPQQTPVNQPTPEPIREPTPQPIREPTPQPIREPTPEPIREPTPEPIREPTPEPIREPTPEPIREPTPEPIREPTPEPIREPTPEPIREPTPEPIREPTPELCDIQPSAQSGSEPVHDLFKFEDTTHKFVPSLGTTVMSPPCSPTGPVSPARGTPNASSLLDFQSDMMNFQKDHTDVEEAKEDDQEEEPDEQENLFISSTAPSAATFSMMAEPHTLTASHFDAFASGDLLSPYEKEEAVEKADEEINEDDDDEEDEDEDQNRFGHQPSSMITDLSSSQPSEEVQVRSSAFGGSSGWHGDDLLSGMDSEDMSSCTSSRQHGVSDLSSTQHTAILEGTQSSDALVDSSLRGSEGDANLTGSPNVETLANEEDDDEDEEDERVDEMDLSSERLEEHHKAFQLQEHDEEDEDVEMHSEGKTESGGNYEEDFIEEERLDNLNQSGLSVNNPSTSSWGETNPFCDTWTQPASVVSVSSPSPISDHGAADSETPTQSPAQTCFDSTVPSFAPQSEEDPEHNFSAHKNVDLLAAPAVDIPVRHSGSETSTPEDLREYDSSSGVESRSDKQQTPLPAQHQPDMDQDLGIHMEKGDGEEEEAETLPADEVLGTGPPTAPASAPSSASTSGDEASDTEGEIQINDPDAPMIVGESARFESPTPTSNLPALEEDEEGVHATAGEGEEDGGGATPQSANSVASYGFDCTNSNSNAHSMAESCGKSPGIFSLENEEQLPEEAKDPSLIKELTLPSAAAAADDLLEHPVDLMPLGHSGDHSSLDEHHYMLGVKMDTDLLHDVDPQEPAHRHGNQDSGDSEEDQPLYYSTICDKTDSFLEGDNISDEEEIEDDTLLTQKDNQNQNHSGSVPIANGHYLALVPGNRRPIDPALAAHFAHVAPHPYLIESCGDSPIVGEQLRRLEHHQEKLREVQQNKEQERQKRHWLEEEQLRLEQQRQLEEQRRELLQLQLQQQQQEHRQRRQRLQWQLELEQQYRMHQKHLQQQQQLRKSPTGLMLSPSSGLCTIYEAMETSDEEDEMDTNAHTEVVVNGHSSGRENETQKQLYPVQELEWNMKVDMVQQLINQTLMLSGDGSCPLLLLPVGTGGILSPLKSSMWPHLLPQFSPPAATVTSVSSYCPDIQGSSPPGDWTVVEVETQH